MTDAELQAELIALRMANRRLEGLTASGAQGPVFYRDAPPARSKPITGEWRNIATKRAHDLELQVQRLRNKRLEAWTI